MVTHRRQLGPLLVVATLALVGVVTVAGTFGVWWWLDGQYGRDVPMGELVAGRPIIHVTFDGELDAGEVAALAAARGTDEALLQRWYDLLLRTDGDLVVAGDGWVRLQLDVDRSHAITLDVEPSRLPAPGEQPRTVAVRLDLGADGLAAATTALTGDDTSVGDVVQRLLWTPAGPLLDESVAGGRARAEVDAEVAGAGGLSWLDGGIEGISARGSQVTMPAELVAGVTDLLLGVPAQRLLAASDDEPVDLGPTAIGTDAPVSTGGIQGAPHHRVEVEGSGRRLALGPSIEVDLVALLATGLRARGDDDAAAVVERWETTTLWVTLERRGQGPDQLHVRDDVQRLGLSELLAPAAPEVTAAPDEVAVREFEQGIGFLAAAAVELREETGAYPTTITEVVAASDLAVDPIHPLSTLGWLYRVGATSPNGMCIEARHEAGAVWSARASEGWTATAGAC